jgi:TonB family protein
MKNIVGLLIVSLLLGGIGQCVQAQETSAAISTTDTLPIADEKNEIRIGPAICDQSAYPQPGEKREGQGPVFGNLKVDANGKVIEVRISKSSGYRDPDKAAVTFFATCKLTSVELVAKGKARWYVYSFGDDGKIEYSCEH